MAAFLCCAQALREANNARLKILLADAVELSNASDKPFFVRFLKRLGNAKAHELRLTYAVFIR